MSCPIYYHNDNARILPKAILSVSFYFYIPVFIALRLYVCGGDDAGSNLEDEVVTGKSA
jgi:hypothetical protein